jgi:hypothetical protein
MSSKHRFEQDPVLKVPEFTVERLYEEFENNGRKMSYLPDLDAHSRASDRE